MEKHEIKILNWPMSRKEFAGFSRSNIFTFKWTLKNFKSLIHLKEEINYKHVFLGVDCTLRVNDGEEDFELKISCKEFFTAGLVICNACNDIWYENSIISTEHDPIRLEEEVDRVHILEEFDPFRMPHDYNPSNLYVLYPNSNLYYDGVLAHLKNTEYAFAKLNTYPHEDIIFYIFLARNFRGEIPKMELQESIFQLANNLSDSKASLSEKIMLRVDEETESVHKAVICARSPVFARMLDTTMKEQETNQVLIDDIAMPVVKIFISYLYTSILKECDFTTLCGLYYAADKYEVPDLHKACANKLIASINTSNVCNVLCLAHRHGDKKLKLGATTFLKSNFESIIPTDGWEQLMKSDLQLALDVCLKVKFHEEISVGENNQ